MTSSRNHFKTFQRLYVALVGPDTAFVVKFQMKNKRAIKAPLVKDLVMNYLLPLSRFEAFLLTVKAVRSAKFASLTFTCSWRRDLSFLLMYVHLE